jgi:plasmid stability protein
MPTLFVENVPEELYEALRARAQKNRKSIAAEVLALLEENVPTPAELARRKKWWEPTRQLPSWKSLVWKLRLPSLVA